MAAQPGQTVLEVARAHGVHIPTLCHDPRLEPTGACRMCLVEIAGQRRLQPACTWKATPGLAAQTRGDRVDRHRRLLLSMYLADHVRGRHDPLAPTDQLEALALRYGAGVDLPRVDAPRAGRPDANPYIHFDPDLCILCGRCVRYCDEVEGVNAITLAGRGSQTTIATAGDKGLLETTCELCGGCIDVCPTGAMREKKPMAMVATAPATAVRSTCNFCGVGCQVDLHVSDGRLAKVTSPPPGSTVNDGNLCVKGRFAYDFIHHDDRLKVPLVRGHDGALHEATWSEALAAVTRRVQPGCVWMPLHFAEESANVLTNDAGDAVTGTAEYKVCAVRLAPSAGAMAK